LLNLLLRSSGILVRQLLNIPVLALLTLLAATPLRAQQPPAAASAAAPAKDHSVVVGVWWGFGESLDMMSYTDRWGTGGTTADGRVIRMTFLYLDETGIGLALHTLTKKP
jgi:hypothetical protein